MQDTSGWINQRLEVLVRMIQEETLDKGDINSEIVLTSFLATQVKSILATTRKKVPSEQKPGELIIIINNKPEHLDILKVRYLSLE